MLGLLLEVRNSLFTQSCKCLKVLIEHFHNTWRDQKWLIMNNLQSQDQESWEALDDAGWDGRFHIVQTSLDTMWSFTNPHVCGRRQFNSNLITMLSYFHNNEFCIFSSLCLMLGPSELCHRASGLESKLGHSRSYLLMDTVVSKWVVAHFKTTKASPSGSGEKDPLPIRVPLCHAYTWLLE